MPADLTHRDRIDAIHHLAWLDDVQLDDTDGDVDLLVHVSAWTDLRANADPPEDEARALGYLRAAAHLLGLAYADSDGAEDVGRVMDACWQAVKRRETP